MQHDNPPRWSRRSGLAFLTFLGALTVATSAMVGPFGLTSPASGQPRAPSGEYRVELGVAWRNVDGEVLRLDAYVPLDERRHAAVVLVHGGAWTGGDKADVAEQGRVAGRSRIRRRRRQLPAGTRPPVPGGGRGCAGRGGMVAGPLPGRELPGRS